MAEKYFLYARKSTDTEERQVRSIEDQLTELHSLASKEGIIIKKIFTESMTAKVPGRPLFNEMISRIEKGEAQGIISWHPDRLARNALDGGQIINLLDIGSLKFLKFPTFWFDNTPQGKFMLNVSFGQSKYYIDNLSENVRRGQRQKLSRGEWPGWAPLGYLNDKNLRKIVADPVKGPLVRKLFETHASGNYTLQDLRKVTAAWGLVSRQNTPLSKSELHRTLTRPFFYGLMKYSGEWHQGSHEPLVSKELFDQVQKVLVRQSKPNKYRKHTFPLLGLAICETCGCSITAERQKGYHYYRCTKKRGVCAQPYIREEKLAEQIKESIQQVALPDETFQYLMAQWAKEEANARQPVEALQEKISKEVPGIESKLNRLLDAHLEGIITQSEYLAKKESLLNQKVELEERLTKLKKGATGWLELAKKFLQTAHQAGFLSEGSNLAAQRKFLKKIGSNFRLGGRLLSFQFSDHWEIIAKSSLNLASLAVTRSARDPWGAGGADPEGSAHLASSSSVPLYGAGLGSSLLAAHAAENFEKSDTFIKMRREWDSNPRYRLR